MSRKTNISMSRPPMRERMARAAGHLIWPSSYTGSPLGSQILRLVGVIVVCGIAVGGIAGVTAAARNEPAVLVQTPSDPDELAVLPPDVAVPVQPPRSQSLLPGVSAPERLGDTFLLEVEERGVPVDEPAAAPVSKPRIAIIIDDLGLHPARATALSNLTVPLTLSWLPYSENLREQTRRAMERGHQIFAHVPMQPTGDEDPGPNALMTWHGKAEIKALLDKQLTEFTGLTGINNHMGSRFTANYMSMTWLMGEIEARNLLFVDSLTSPLSQGAKVAKAHGMPFLQRDFFIDHEARGNPDLITKRLADLEALARERGEVVAIGHPYEVTIAGLQAWIPEAQARGIEFITIAQLRSVPGFSSSFITYSYSN